MKTLNFSVTLLAASLLVSASAFAATPGGGALGGLSCNLVADAKDNPECAAYLKNKSQNLTPSPLQATEKATGQKK